MIERLGIFNNIEMYFLAWETPWTEEPGGLQSTGSQKARRLSNQTTTTTNAALCLQNIPSNFMIENIRV